MDTGRTITGPALIGRVVWMMVGPITLFLIAVTIAGQRQAGFSLANLAYFPVLGAMMYGRWLEFRLGHPMTSTGEPATEADLRRYLLGAAIVGFVVWIVANLVGFAG